MFGLIDNDSYLTVSDGRLCIDGVDAVELARSHATPLFIYSEARIRRNIARLTDSGGSIPCPIKVCYAAKAMSTLGILRAIRNAECDIEVNSGGELWKALRAGFSGDRIIFNGTSKEAWEIELAIQNDVYAIQADSVYELSLIEAAARSLGTNANVSLRLVPEIESGTHSGLRTALLTSKFGMMPDEAFAAIAQYADSDHLVIRGIHLHVGSQNPDPSVYTEALATLGRFALRLGRISSRPIKHINIGGGFPVDHIGGTQADINEDQAAILSAYFDPAGALESAWQRLAAADPAAAEAVSKLTLLIEPGRSIIGDAGICLTTVRNAKSRPNADMPGGVDQWLLTDAGFNILLSMETYKWYYHLISAQRTGVPHETRYKVAGPLCDGGDVYFDIEGKGRLPEYRMLPAGVEPGEVLALLNCGAYSLAQASQYNGRFLPAVVLIGIDGTPQLIRRRETLDDLIRADSLT